MNYSIMKIQEIRVGNWFTFVKWDKPVICELTDLMELCVRSDGAYDDPPIDEMFAPIPLTEEWLLKFGFEKDKRWTKGRLENTHFMITRDRGRYSLFGRGRVPLKYVHQLQSLFWCLTGNELEIK